jgi:hypothetical protein
VMPSCAVASNGPARPAGAAGRMIERKESHDKGYPRQPSVLDGAAHLSGSRQVEIVQQGGGRT